MPSPADRPRLCIIGDSHIGSVRLAERDGLVDFSGYEVEYFGAAGPSFRGLMLADERIVVRGEAAREDFARINGAGRTTVEPGEFDEFLFYGCRVGSAEFFGGFLQRQLGEGGWQSHAAMQCAARSFLASSRAYRIAAIFARDHSAQVSFVPVPLTTADVVDQTQTGYFLDLYPDAVGATESDRSALWQALVEAAAVDQVRLIPQPDGTVINGAFTDPVFAVDGAREKQDADHKSPEFAALMLTTWNPAVAPGAAAMRA